MQYDFESYIRRVGAGSRKWDEMCELYPDPPENMVPLSVADMELRNPPEIIEGLKEFLDNTILGYTGPTQAYFDSVISWMERRHGFASKREWFVETPGIVPAIEQLVSAYTQPGDGVLVTPPVYYPFFHIVKGCGRKIITSALVARGRTYDIDFDDFAAKAALPETKLFILCSPHNPVGRVWTREELIRISEICLENEVYIISDEIHSDIIMPGHRFTSIANLGGEFFENCALCTAPSKTFNMAGVQVSNLFIPNEQRRAKLREARGYSSLNIFAYKACEIAYNRCEQWLEQLIVHIDSNRQLAESFFSEKIPGVKVYELQGTYLLWLDFRCFGLNDKDLETFLRRKAGWFTDEGYIFGEGGSGFERLHLAVPGSALEYMLNRLYTALAEENMLHASC